MSIGERKISVQFGERGFSGRVRLFAIETDTGKFELECAKEIASEEWQDAFQSGIQYVAAFARRNGMPLGLKVAILEFQFHDVDTNEALVAYLTALAIYDALEIPPDPLLHYRWLGNHEPEAVLQSATPQ